MRISNIKINVLTCLLILAGLLTKAQVSGTITLGPDITVPTCVPCTTIKATTTAPSIGTNNYTVNQITYTPYSFAPGTIIPLNVDDMWSSIIPIPFDFCFYGNTYNQCIVSSNGQVSFNIAQANTFNPWAFGAVAPMPNAAFTAAHNSIMAPYHDILPTTLGIMSYQTIGTAPNRVFVVSWNNSPMFSCTNLLVSQQIAMYEGTNVIETYISNKPFCGWNSSLAIHGIQNNGGTIAHIVPGRNLPTQWTATNDAWSFQPTGGGGGGGQAGVSFEWFNMNNPNVPLATTADSLVVCDTVTSAYRAIATFYLCGGIEKDTDEITIIKQLPIQLSVPNITDVNCYAGADGAFTVSATGGTNTFSYTVNGNPMSGSTQTGLIAGTYTVVATDGSNCTASTEITINQPTEVLIAIVDQVDVKCKYQRTGSVLLDAVGGVPSYLYWYGSNAASLNPSMETLAAGTYRFYVADSHGCLDSVDTEILQPDSLLSVYLIPQIATCINKADGSVESIASGGVPPYNYEWNSRPPQYTPTATGLETGVYHVLVTDANGCITATQSPVEQQLCCQIFLPDAFSPNNDTKNDVYRILEYGGGVIMGEFRIYNRWGQEVFSTRDITKGWDGNFKGQPQNMDTYNYVVVYQCNEKGVISQKVKKGDLILVR
jgi:gliding motility-associated-like protein